MGLNYQWIISEDLEVAESFNKYFVDKIESLKENIDKNLITDPLAKLNI